jgi:predicted ArsR family transcriptional regulator
VQSVEVTSGHETEHGTRERVTRAVLARGPVTAAQLSSELGITPAAVRRHLDALVAAGLVEGREGTGAGQRGPGRPARRFVATAAGHAAAVSAYDDLATAALRSLAAEAGPEAVGRFARARAGELEERYRPVVEAAGPGVRERAGALAGALSGDGYAATARPAGSTGPQQQTVQLCQGHCPVHAVAAQFPELCDAEAEVFARLLGAPVRRLATLASGHHACTTHVTTPATTRTTHAAPARDPELHPAPSGGTDHS